MNATMAIMAREVGARRELFLLAAAVAVIAGVVPLLPGIDSANDVDLRTVASITSALALGWLLAIIFGATLIGRDLADGRLGFFFARPVSSWAIWVGKVAAAILLVWMCEAIVLLPSLHGGGIYNFLTGEGIGRAALVGYLAVPLLLLLLAHAVGIMVRARTAWFFLDLAGLVVFAVIAWITVLPFLATFAVIAPWVIGGALFASLVIALGVGGAIGVAVGRVDLYRSHGALSLGLWATLAVCLAGITIGAGWLRAFGPSDFDEIDVLTASPDGLWVEVLGGAPRRLDVRRRCLVSVVDHRWIPLPGPGLSGLREVVYSRDGSTALWLGAGLGDDPRALWWADLGRPDPSARSSNLLVPWEAVFILSPDGKRLAVMEEGTLSVYGLGDERLLTAVRLPGELNRASVLFDTADTLRIFARSSEKEGHTLFLAEIDAVTGAVNRTGQIDDLAKESWFVVNSELNHLVMWTRVEDQGRRIYTAFEAKTGTLVTGLSGPGFQSFLADGRLVALDVDEGGQPLLVVESVDEGDRWVHDLGNAKDPRLSGEVLPGVVAVSQLADPSDHTKGLSVDLIDVESGQTQNIGAHLRRALPWFRWLQGHTRGIFWYGNQPATSRLFIDQTGALVRWDPETGELIHVVGGRK